MDIPITAYFGTEKGMYDLFHATLTEKLPFATMRLVIQDGVLGTVGINVITNHETIGDCGLLICYGDIYS